MNTADFAHVTVRRIDQEVYLAAISRAIHAAELRGVAHVEWETLPMADDERAACVRAVAANARTMIAEMRAKAS